MAELICSELSKTYKNFQLAPTSFQLESGYLTVLAGKNGSGKSTLLRCLAGLNTTCSGNVSLDNISMKKYPKDYKNQIGYVSEEITYSMEKSAFENGQILGPYFANWSVERYYTFMDRMDFSPSKQLWQLSKGEYMKMQTCFVLAHQPRFLLMDEPLEGFDPVFRREFLSMMQDILNEDIGILMSSHITETLTNLADYLLFADNGKITFHCPEQMDAFLSKQLHPKHTQIRDLLSRHSQEVTTT